MAGSDKWKWKSPSWGPALGGGGCTYLAAMASQELLSDGPQTHLVSPVLRWLPWLSGAQGWKPPGDGCEGADPAVPLAMRQRFTAAETEPDPISRPCFFRVAMMQGRKVPGTGAAGAALFIYS